jgi:hypothetical protein
LATEDNGARIPEVAPDAGEKFLERLLARTQQGVRMARLRRADAWGGRFRQHVAFENRDLLEIGSNGFRRCQTSHSRANDDGSLRYDGGHFYDLRACEFGHADSQSSLNRRIVIGGAAVTEITHRTGGANAVWRAQTCPRAGPLARQATAAPISFRAAAAFMGWPKAAP